MRLTPLRLQGAFLVELERQEDDRGFFARTWCEEEFAAAGLEATLSQCSISHNRARGTLRGMHYQIPPHEETKVVSCIRGAIYDVIVDLRTGSPTFGQWEATELDAASMKMIYVPRGVAHGLQTLSSDSVVQYFISGAFHAGSALGVRWNDPRFGIDWPLPVSLMSTRDASFDLWP